jgi:hypothetical protein
MTKTSLILPPVRLFIDLKLAARVNSTLILKVYFHEKYFWILDQRPAKRRGMLRNDDSDQFSDCELTPCANARNGSMQRKTRRTLDYNSDFEGEEHLFL